MVPVTRRERSGVNPAVTPNTPLNSSGKRTLPLSPSVTAMRKSPGASAFRLLSTHCSTNRLPSRLNAGTHHSERIDVGQATDRLIVSGGRGEETTRFQLPDLNGATPVIQGEGFASRGKDDLDGGDHGAAVRHTKGPPVGAEQTAACRIVGAQLLPEDE